MPSVAAARSFRIVAPQAMRNAVLDFLQAEGFTFAPEPFSPWCMRLTHAPFPAGSSLAAFFGYIYLQDRSSMLPPLALNPDGPVLDMAASPGGKSGFLAQLAGPDALILANEPAPARLATLRANLHRLSLHSAATCGYEGEKLPLPPASFPYILLDPPCSGWGTAKKNPRVLKLWQGAKIGRLTGMQRNLLRQAASLLAPGGRLLYSTCTTNQAENQEQTAWAADCLGLEPLPLAPFPGFVFEPCAHGALLVNGHASGAQGFYLSLLGKPQGRKAQVPEGKSFHAGFIEPASLAEPLFDPALLPKGRCAVFGDKLRFLPQDALNMLPCGMRWQGALLGKWNDGRFSPDARLRAYFPADAPKIVFDDIAPLRQLLTGASLPAALRERAAAIYWRDLPLGIVQIRHGRALAAFRR